MPPKKGTIHRHGALAEAQTQAILRLAGKPVRVTGQTAPSDLEKLALLAEHVQRLKYPGWNPWVGNFTRFRTEMCFTKDEARAGNVALIPDFKYLREVDDALITERYLFIEKSRRMLLTWTVLAFDLWLAIGGHDPRWPDLMNSNGNRKVVIAARKLEGENGSADFLSRIRFIYEQFENRGLREKWPEFPEARWRFDSATFSNGSVISAVAQGEHQLAGSGITFGHLEEVARWQEQRASISSALQTLTGGGHICLVTTAQAGSYCAKLALDQIRAGGSN